MRIIVQSFGEFKSSQMANAAYSTKSLTRYVVAPVPSGYEGPDAKLDTYRPLRYFEAVGQRLLPGTDLSAYWANRMLDRLASRTHPTCDLLVGYSGSCLRSLRTASAADATTIVYRGAPHGRFFSEEVDRLLVETGFGGVDQRTSRMTSREHREYEIADFVWVPSTFTADSLTRYGIDESKIKVLPYGVNLDVFNPGNQSDNEFSILYVGEVSPEKGVHVLLEAAKRLPEVEVTLIGKVSDRLRDDVGAADNVHAPGWVDRSNLPEYYQQASVFVFPSFADGYPSAVLEALACGCPVVTTWNVGTRTLIEEYGAGTVLEPGSATAIVEAVQRLRDDTERVQRMSDAAVAAIRDGDFGLEPRQHKIADFMHSIAE